MTSVDVLIRGLPVPQGALVRSPSGGLYNRSAGRLGAWRGAVATEARAAMSDRPLIEGPVAVSVLFVLPRPKGHWLPANGRRPVQILRLDAPQWVATTPDVDKLVRACLDALTSVVWRDDAQVAQLTARKRYEGVDPRDEWALVQPGAQIRITSLAATA